MNDIEKTFKDKPTSLRASVNAKCYQCVKADNYKSQIKYCCNFNCALWNVRPFKKGVTKEACLYYKLNKL